MLFSCCDIGKNDTVMKEISTISERTVFAYSSSNIETADDDSAADGLDGGNPDER